MSSVFCEDKRFRFRKVFLDSDGEGEMMKYIFHQASWITIKESWRTSSSACFIDSLPRIVYEREDPHTRGFTRASSAYRSSYRSFSEDCRGSQLTFFCFSCSGPSLIVTCPAVGTPAVVLRGQLMSSTALQAQHSASDP